MSQSILITGCSSGIGLRAAEVLHERGYKVFATARKQADLELLKSKGITALPLEITEAASIKNVLAEVLRHTNGTLDAVFNNAGIVVPGAVEDLTTALIQKQFATNVFGPMELIRQVLPIMRKQGHGRIIQNSSVLGFVTLPYTAAYSASKFALEAFSNALYQELQGTNIFVSCINPGPIDSKLRQHSYEIYKEQDFSQSTNKAVYDKMEKQYFQRGPSEMKWLRQPDTVVAKLIEALESKRPKMHYYVGIVTYLFATLKRLLPETWLATITAKAR